MDSYKDKTNIEILLVDDKAENLLALESVLRSTDYQLIRAQSGDEALRYLLNHMPALILMDVQMPNLDGYETAKLIRNYDRTRHIPIIFMTALHPDTLFTHKGYDHGAVDYIYKPYDPYILKSKVSVFVELAKTTHQLVLAEKQLIEVERRERSYQIAQLELKGLKQEKTLQQKYRDLIEGISHGIVWTMDPISSAVIFASPSAEKMLGFTPKDWLENPSFLFDRLHPDDRALFRLQLERAKAGALDVEFEHRSYSKDGSVIWFHTGIRMNGDFGSESSELRGLSVDITPLKSAQAILKKSQERSQFLAETSLHLAESLDYEKTLKTIGSVIVPKFADFYMIVVADPKYGFRTLSTAHVNPKKAAFFHSFSNTLPRNLDAKSGIGYAIRTGRSQLYREMTDELLRDQTANKEQFETLKGFGLKSGIVVPLIVRKNVFGAIALATSESNYVFDEIDLNTAEDFSRRAGFAIENAKLYKQAQEAILVRDEFLSIASHELKTPLTSLKLQLQLSKRRMDKSTIAFEMDDSLGKTFVASLRQVDALDNLVEELLDVSKIRSGQLTLKLSQVDLSELMKEVADSFNEQLSRAKINLTLSLEPKLVGIWDRSRMRQIALNLISNAIKYAPGKPVEIATHLLGENAEIVVKDSGPGIPVDQQNIVFERFERASATQSASGLGLGLFISKRLAEAHGGMIHLESAPGEGATFKVSLPTRLSMEQASSA